MLLLELLVCSFVFLFVWGMAKMVLFAVFLFAFVYSAVASVCVLLTCMLTCFACYFVLSFGFVVVVGGFFHLFLFFFDSLFVCFD